MAEQLELFPESKRSGESKQKRTQIGYLVHAPEEDVDKQLVLDEWRAQTGEDIIKTLREKLSIVMGCSSEELMFRLREQKFRLLLGGRLNLSGRKLPRISLPSIEWIKSKMA